MDDSSMTSPPANAGTSNRPALRILYADDLPELRDLAQASLSREGHGIECCADGALALTQIEAGANYDLVITDHHMPNLNGLEFVTKLRERDYPAKIMVFSSELSETVAQQYRQHRVDRILFKPVFPSALRKILRELFPPTETQAV